MPAPRKVLARMQDHVLSIAEEHDIAVYHFVGDWRWSEAYRSDGPRLGTITVPTVRRPRDYLISLHELGHLLDPLAVDLEEETGPREALICESAAWAFACTAVLPAFQRHIPVSEWQIAADAWRTYLVLGSRSPKTPVAGP